MIFKVCNGTLDTVLFINKIIQISGIQETTKKNGAEPKSLMSRKIFTYFMIMKLIFKSITIVILMFLVSSCASIVSSSRWPLTVNSEPVGAKVEITNKKGVVVYNGSTPATMELKSGAGYFAKESYSLKVQMNGFADKIVPINCKFNGWYIGNLVFGGLIGILIVDPITGAMYRLDTGIVNVKLDKTTASTEPVLKIMNINDIPSEWKDKLVCIVK